MKRVIVNGADGRMGSITASTIGRHEHFELVAKGTHTTNLASLIKAHDADIVIDFTEPHCVYENMQTILDLDAHPIIGTSGLNNEQIQALTTRCAQEKKGAIIAPNFSLGAILMMKYAEDAAQYFKYAEIIEMHHENKVDAPSGTAVKTAQLMSKNLGDIPHHPDSHESIAGARGALYNTIPIHSVRLPGLVAHQQVLFGGNGETLSFKHDSNSRESFMPGVILACMKVTALTMLVYGLEHLI